MRACVLTGSALCCVVASGLAMAQQTSVVDGPHNLSVSGPGTTRAVSEDQVCIFCHAPHNSTPVRPLWNRSMPVDAYSIYSSPSLDADPGQPTGSSKMCLSCHDGTIALGAVVSRDTPIVMAGGRQTLSDGTGHIGTDLSDDHPISFRYDSTLAARDPLLKPPSVLPDQVRLDPNGELQCTSCHDAHNNFFGDFMVMANSDSELCITCHAVGTTTVQAHRQCSACHQSHTAPSGPYLLRRSTVSETCLACHDGSVPMAADVADDMRKLAVHDTAAPIAFQEQDDQTNCTSCHDPHTMGSGSGAPPAIHPNLGRIDGVNASGSPIPAANTEFEVCFKCHADGDRTRPMVNRVIAQTNTRLEFSPTAVSFHPVQSPGRNSDVPSLLPPWTTASMMYCSDCHGSESNLTPGDPSRGGGVHGSNYEGLLRARYETSDETSESAAAYALCYTCHNRDHILSEENSSFPGHRRHVVEERTPCSACHDAHGIPSTQGSTMNNSNLINFDTRIVLPNARGRLEFRDTGRFRGECFLQCHGRDHDPLGYEQN